jgi:MFS transporter, DHA3 family, macrolide efflux protein
LLSGLAAPGIRRSPFAIFGNRSFRWLWTAELVNEMGSSITALASSIYIYQTTGSALNVGLMMIAAVVPSLFVGLVAGVFVDRYNRKRIMIAANLIQAGLVLAIPFLLPVSIVWLYVLVMLSSAVGQFFKPAHASVLPEIASDEELNAANSLMAISSFGSMAIGFALSGLITGRYAIEWAFYLDSLTFVVSALFIGLVSVPPVKIDEDTTVRVVVRNLQAGLRLIAQTTILRSLFLVFLPMFLLFGLLNTLRLPFSIEVLGATEFEFGLIESVTLLGFVLASLLMARFGDRLREGQWLAASFLGMAITAIAFSLNEVVGLALMISAVEGFMNAPSVIARSVIIQRYAPREARGRVFSAFFVMRDVFFMLGMAAAGLADFFDVQLLYLVGGVLGGVVALASLFMPALRLPAAMWKRAASLLRHAPDTVGLSVGHGLTPADYQRLRQLVPALNLCTPATHDRLHAGMALYDVPEHTTVMRRDDRSSEAYFILEGQAIAGLEEDGRFQLLEVLREGDFFGEIAALTGVPRTANVVTERPSRLVKVEASTLREMAADPELNRLFTTRMAERMLRLRLIDLPRAAGLDANMLRDLRTPTGEPEPL